MIDQFLFGVYPYIALAVLILGSIVRYERDPFTWKSKSSQLLRRKQLILGSVLFHVGVLVIFFGHLFGLLTPLAVFDTLGVAHSFKQIMAIVVGGIAGVAALIGGLTLLHRRLVDPRVRATTTLADTGILAILVLQVILGLSTIVVSLEHTDGAEMVRFMAWAQGVFTLQPAVAGYVADTHWLFKLHIFLGLTIFVLFPFTRLVHMLSAPVRYLWRPGYQIVRSRRSTPIRRPGENEAAAPVRPARPARTAADPGWTSVPAE